MTTIESLLTVQEALRANAAALTPAIWEAAERAAREIGAGSFADAWEIAISAEHDGEFYKTAVKPAIRFCARDAFPLETSKRNAWLQVARGAIQRYRAAYCSKDWTPTPGTLETLTCYFWRVCYAELIEEVKAGAELTP